MPPKLQRFRHLRRSRFRLLDVGCGNHSPALAKRWFPACEYHGLDREQYNNGEQDYRLMNCFYQADLAASDLAGIPDGYFDVIVFAHVIEHLPNGIAVLERIIAKLAPGGEIYIEFPSVRSLALPSAPGSLNFCDDKTHLRLYTVPEICNALLAAGVTVRRAGRRRHWPKLLLTPITATASWLRYGAVQGGPLWDLCGFADYVWAAKPASRGSANPGGVASRDPAAPQRQL
ncbi:MAG: class I SAM-dependent methyltransferase [Terriglobales bacterium]